MPSVPGDQRVADGPITILITDAEGSTALHSAKGDAQARAVLDAGDRVVREQVVDQGGRVIISTGDGLMAAFTSPRRAVACALGINQAITEHSQRNPHLSMRVHIGLHTGEVIEGEGDLHGAAVAAATRICARAKGGEILASGVVRQLCGTLPGALFLKRGSLSLKGFPERWHLFRIIPAVRAPDRLKRTPFVGRHKVLAELRGLLDCASGEQGALVLIGGEPGVGKTRLTQELATHAQQLGIGVFTGSCYEREGDLPYMPWLEIFVAAARPLTPSALRRTLGEHASALAQMVPELRQMVPDIPAHVELPMEQQRRYLFRSATEYVSGVARGRPHLLILEDLQWADESTLLLLEHLAQHVDGIPLLLLGTYRNPRLDVSDALLATIARMLHRHEVNLMSLEGFTVSEVGAMLQGLSGYSPPAEIAAAVYAESDGNAFFVEELFRHLADAGKLLDEAGGFRTDLTIDELDVPGNVRLVIGQRLRRLAEPTRRTLAIAAIMGRHFSFEVLEAVADTLTDDLFEAIEEAQMAKLIVEEHDDIQLQYRFAHELIRQTILTELSAPRRQRYHLRIAEALQQLHNDDLESHAADIARHLLQSGVNADPARTAHHLTLAGDRAQAAAAYEEALRAYLHALAVLPASEVRNRADLLVKVAFAQRSLHHWAEAVAAWDDALSLLEAHGEGEAVASVCWDLSQQLIWAYRFGEMAEVARRGLVALGDRPSPHRARLLSITGLALGAGGRPEAAAEHIVEALRLAEQDGDAHLLGDVGLAETVHHYFHMQLPEVVEAARRASEKLREVGSLWNLADALVFQEVALAFQGHFLDADALHSELQPLAERLGHWGALSVAGRTAFAVAGARQGDLTTLDELSRVRIGESDETSDPNWIAWSHTLRGVVAFWRGDWPQAIEWSEKGARQASAFWASPQRGFLLLVHAFMGNRDETYAQLDQLNDALPRVGRANLVGAWNLASFAAEAIGVVGDRERARTLYDLVIEALATGVLLRQVDGRLVQTSAGMVAASAGLWDEAEEHFESALRQAEELPHLIERPNVRDSYARFLVARGGRGDRERAHRLLIEAVDGFHARGMRRHETRAQQLLSGLTDKTDVQ